MWLVRESKNVIKQLRKCPPNILEEYELWKKIVELSGPQALKKISGYHDHALKGEWLGARSSYLNRQWRVIYFISKKEVQVFIMEVNAHDYRKKVKDILKNESFVYCKSRISLTQGMALRILREKNDFSQNQLAQLTGLTQSTISSIENDRISIGIERAKILAKVLNVHPAVLAFPDWEIAA